MAEKVLGLSDEGVLRFFTGRVHVRDYDHDGVGDVVENGTWDVRLHAGERESQARGTFYGSEYSLAQ